KIAKGEPPGWVLAGLDHFSKFIGRPRLNPKMTSKEARKIDEDMLEAAKYLEKWLQTYEGLEELGFECPECVHTMLATLPEVIDLLETDINEARASKNRKPDAKRLICASAVIEAWQLMHGKINEPNSKDLLELCRDYWLACGRDWTDEADNPDNWRRPITYAIADGQDVLDIFEMYRMSDK